MRPPLEQPRAVPPWQALAFGQSRPCLCQAGATCLPPARVSPLPFGTLACALLACWCVHLSEDSHALPSAILHAQRCCLLEHQGAAVGGATLPRMLLKVSDPHMALGTAHGCGLRNTPHACLHPSMCQHCPFKSGVCMQPPPLTQAPTASPRRLNYWYARKLCGSGGCGQPSLGAS